MVGGAAEEAIGQHAERSGDCSVIFGRRRTSSQREDSENEHRVPDPFARSGARGGGHGRHGAPRRQERRERTRCRPAQDRARATPELRQESRLGFAPLPAATRSVERAIGMPGSPAGGSGPASPAATCREGWGWGRSGGVKRPLLFHSRSDQPPAIPAVSARGTSTGRWQEPASAPARQIRSWWRDRLRLERQFIQRPLMISRCPWARNWWRAATASRIFPRSALENSISVWHPVQWR